MKSKLYLLIPFLFLTCQKNQTNTKLQNKLISSEAQKWLKTNGQSLSKETVSFTLSENIKIEGILSWNLSSVTEKESATVIKVPYIFEKSSFSKNSRLLLFSDPNELPITVNLYIIKKNNGQYSAALKITAYDESPSNRKIYSTVYDADLKKVNEKLIEGTKSYTLTVIDIPTNQNISLRTESNCEELSYSYSYAVSCESNGTNSTLCTYKKKKVTRYRCYGEFGSGEEEQIDWISNDDPAGGGWTEYEEETEEFANQNIIDSLQGNPCAQDVLKHLPNINQTTTDILKTVFGVNDQINLKFLPSDNLNDNVDGETTCGGSSSSFNCTIKLNSRIIQQATKEYIVAIFIHEALHAYINYQRTILDTTTFKTKFPIYWAYRGNDAQHNEMANNYISMMASVIQGFNPNISLANAQALAWGGLDMTTVWKNKSDTNFVKQVNTAGRTPTDNNYINYNFIKCQ